MNVSVIVATYGHRDWAILAERAAKSADGQGANEVIVLHQDDATLAQVRNKAADAASGDWLCYLDADDELAPGYLDAMRAKLDACYMPPLELGLVRDYAFNVENDMVVYGEPGETFVLVDEQKPSFLLVPAVQYVTPEGQCLNQPRIPDWGRPLIDVNCCVIGTLIPRALFVRIGGFREHLADGTELAALEDWDFFLRCVLAGAQLVPVEAAVYCANAGVFARRNRDQSLYWKIRAELEPAYLELKATTG